MQSDKVPYAFTLALMQGVNSSFINTASYIVRAKIIIPAKTIIPKPRLILA